MTSGPLENLAVSAPASPSAGVETHNEPRQGAPDRKDRKDQPSFEKPALRPLAHGREALCIDDGVVDASDFLEEDKAGDNRDDGEKPMNQDYMSAAGL